MCVGSGAHAIVAAWPCPSNLPLESCPPPPPPQVIMDHMPDTQTLTTEHVKSHLQKQRLHSARWVGGHALVACPFGGGDESSDEGPGGRGSNGPPAAPQLLPRQI